MILLYHRWCTSVNRGRNILKISQSAKWQTRVISQMAWRMNPILPICGSLRGGCWLHGDAPCWFAFQCAALFRATVLAHEKWPIRASLRPLDIYIYVFGSQSCATRLIFAGSARLSAQNKAARGTSGRVRPEFATLIWRKGVFSQWRCGFDACRLHNNLGIRLRMGLPSPSSRGFRPWCRAGA